jgi:hypothetical protein
VPAVLVALVWLLLFQVLRFFMPAAAEVELRKQAAPAELAERAAAAPAVNLEVHPVLPVRAEAAAAVE